ncbi:MAG: cytochrome c [Deltaproteobacteria bacterium]|nr:cytochrome c [Deltaproteobacteria bacterium]
MHQTIKRMPSGKNISRALAIIIFLALCIIPASGQEQKIKDLKKFYQENCAKCHGPDGSAVGDDGKKLKGEDFTDQKWQEETKDDVMVNAILEGKFFGLAMPAYKEIIAEEDAQLMVTEIIRKSQKGKAIKPDAE